VKIYEIQGGSRDGRLMANFNNDDSDEFGANPTECGEGRTNSPKLSLYH